MKDKEGHNILMKSSNHQEDIIITNIYAPNNKYHKIYEANLTKTKGDKDRQKIILGEVNIPFLIMNKQNNQTEDQ